MFLDNYYGLETIYAVIVALKTFPLSQIPAFLCNFLMLSKYLWFYRVMFVNIHSIPMLDMLYLTCFYLNNSFIITHPLSNVPIIKMVSTALNSSTDLTQFTICNVLPPFWTHKYYFPYGGSFNYFRVCFSGDSFWERWNFQPYKYIYHCCDIMCHYWYYSSGLNKTVILCNF